MMRLPSFLALAAILVFVGTGCSRLTFVKPASKRIAYEEKGSAYSVSDSTATKQRLATQDRLALAIFEAINTFRERREKPAQ